MAATSSGSRSSSEEDDVDAKSHIAQRIFESLIHDAFVQIAFQANDDESARRRNEKKAHSTAMAKGENEVDRSPPLGLAPPSISQGMERSGSASTTGMSSPMRGTPAPTSSAPSRDANNLISSTYSANPLIRCLACNRQIASNRYAPHLAKCMGLGAIASAKSSGGLKRKAAAASSSAMAPNPTNTSSASTPSGHTGNAASKRGRPPKWSKGGGLDSARSTATPGPKEGSIPR